MIFSLSELQDAARYLHSQGIERTPDQLREMFVGMICDLRRWRPQETFGLSDAAVWDMVRGRLGLFQA